MATGTRISVPLNYAVLASSPNCIDQRHEGIRGRDRMRLRDGREAILSKAHFEIMRLVIDVIVAERVGFEPTLEFPLNTLSKRAPSTTRPSLLDRVRASLAI